MSNSIKRKLLAKVIQSQDSTRLEAFQVMRQLVHELDRDFDDNGSFVIECDYQYDERICKNVELS